MTDRTSAARIRDTEDDEADLVIRSFVPVVSGIQATFGRKCEVVLHDYRHEEHSAVAVAGTITDRKVGSPMSEIGLSLKQQGDRADDQLNYLIRLPDGRQMKSSTMLLRIASGRVVGALCINIDVSELRAMGQILAEISGDAGTDGATGPDASPHFANDIAAVIDAALADIERTMGRALTRLTPTEWTEVFRSLDRRGLFQMRRAVPLLADRLGLSRASIYNHLARARDTEPEG